jgi:hypothetical protein
MARGPLRGAERITDILSRRHMGGERNHDKAGGARSGLVGRAMSNWWQVLSTGGRCEGRGFESGVDGHWKEVAGTWGTVEIAGASTVGWYVNVTPD